MLRKQARGTAKQYGQKRAPMAAEWWWLRMLCLPVLLFRYLLLPGPTIPSALPPHPQLLPAAAGVRAAPAA